MQTLLHHLALPASAARSSALSGTSLQRCLARLLDAVERQMHLCLCEYGDTKHRETAAQMAFRPPLRAPAGCDLRRRQRVGSAEARRPDVTVELLLPRAGSTFDAMTHALSAPLRGRCSGFICPLKTKARARMPAPRGETLARSFRGSRSSWCSGVSARLRISRRGTSRPARAPRR